MSVAKLVSGCKERVFVTVELYQMADLVAADLNGFSDPYCDVWVGKQRWKSVVKKKTLNPVWDCRDERPPSAVFTSPGGSQLKVEITVMDHDRIGKHDFLGDLVIDLSQWEINTSKYQWWPLEHTSSGEICLRVTVETEAFVRQSIIKALPKK